MHWLVHQYFSLILIICLAQYMTNGIMKDLSTMYWLYCALWDRRHEGATRMMHMMHYKAEICKQISNAGVDETWIVENLCMVLRVTCMTTPLWFHNDAGVTNFMQTINAVMYRWLMIKSPRYTGGDFMFLYPFVRRRPQILVHAITFEQLFGFLSFLARLLALTCRLPN